MPTKKELPEIPQSVAKRTATQLSVLLLFLAGLLVLDAARSLVVLLVVAIIAAVSLNPLTNLIQRFVKIRVIAVLASMALVGLIVLLLAIAFLPELIKQSKAFINNIPQITQEIANNAKVQSFVKKYNLAGDASQLKAQIPQFLSGNASTIISASLGVISFFTSVFIVVSLTFFLLLEGPTTWRSILDLYIGDRREQISRVGGNIAGSIGGYISGNLFISLIAGVVAFIIMKLLGIPYAAPLAVVVAFFDLVPLVGSQIAALIVGLVGLSISWPTAILAVVGLTIYQIIENNVLQPFIYGRTVNLSPLIVFIAVIAGAKIYGLVGVLLAIPAAATLQILFVELIRDPRVRSGKAKKLE